MRKISIRNGAKKTARAIDLSKVAPASTLDVNKARFTSIEKALKRISSRLPAGKCNLFHHPTDDVNIANRKGRAQRGEGDQGAKRRRKTLSEMKGRWRKGSGEGEAFYEGERQREREEEEGVRTLRRSKSSLLFNGDVVPDTVLQVPFQALVSYFRDQMPPAARFVTLTPVFKSSRVLNVPDYIERMLSFNWKILPHCDLNPARIMRGFEEFKPSCTNRMYFHHKAKDPLLPSTILKKLYQRSGWEVDDDDRHTGWVMVFARVEEYLRESLAATLST